MLLILSFSDYILESMVLIIPPLHECQVIELDIGVFADDDAPPAPQEVVQHLSQR